MKNNTHIKNPNKNGFVSLMAGIIAAIILVIGTGVIGIAIRDLKLARIQQASLGAFYAADVGLDCALHLDLLDVDLNTPGQQTLDDLANIASPFIPANQQPNGSTEFRCRGGGVDAPLDRSGFIQVGTQGTYPWGYKTDLTSSSPVSLSTGACVRMTIEKIATSATDLKTIITSRGNSANCAAGSGYAGVERVLVIEWGG